MYNDTNNRQKALQYAHKALELDPADSRNQLNIAWICTLSRDFANGFKYFNIAVDLYPIDSVVLISRTQGMAYIGHDELWLSHAREATRLNPTHPEYYLGYLATTQFRAGEYEDRITTIGQLGKISPESLTFLVAAYSSTGRR